MIDAYRVVPHLVVVLHVSIGQPVRRFAQEFDSAAQSLSVAVDVEQRELVFRSPEAKRCVEVAQ
jgi:hypothetical protein